MEDYKNLTSNVSKTCAVRGGILPFYSINQVSKTFNKVTTVSFSIHTVTHIDLPWSIDWEQIKEFISEIKIAISSEVKEANEKKRLSNILENFDKLGITENYMNKVIDEFKTKHFEIENEFYKWIEKKCIVLDFTEKKDVIENFLSDDCQRSSLFLKENLTNVEALFLFEQLKITKKDIIKKLEDIKKKLGEKFYSDALKNKIIIFKTTWTEYFLPYKMDINNPIFEGWHTFLTYPYLTSDAINYLIAEDVAGIASDSVSLENPLIYVNFLSDNFKNYLIEPGSIEYSISPLHISFLTHKKIIIENLWYLIDVNSMIGTLYVFPYNLGASDGAICSVFYKEKN